MSVSLTDPKPIKDAVDNISARTPMGTALGSAELEMLPREILGRSFFSATVEEVKLLEAMQRQLMTRLKLERRRLADGSQGSFQRKDQFLREMQLLAERMGARPSGERRGTLRDIGSFRRLGLIWDTQMDMARGYAKWKRGMNKNLLNAAPAQELIRIGRRRVPRDWQSRWVEAGGELYPGGRMMALKTDVIWERISRFEQPYPPFDFNSGMGVRNVRRREAEEHGIVQRGEVIEAPELDNFNAGLSINLKGYERSKQPIKDRLGDMVDVYDDRVEWRGDKLVALYERAEKRVNGENFEKKLKAVSFGKVDKALAERVRPIMEIDDFKFVMGEDDVFHILNRHGAGREQLPGQRPINYDDFMYLLVSWRNPVRVIPGDKPRSFEMVFEHLGELVSVLWNQHANQKAVLLNTMWANR
ncbi:hypothetical protein [Rubritalea sp.]|uniref:hypothetical protein n=1 Tax=Rubritalea sp. TaxID=2109375 RepID=UPI003EF3D62E